MIHFKIHSKTACQTKNLKSVGNICFLLVLKSRDFIISRRQICLFVLFYVLKRRHTLSLERGHIWSMVPVARVTMSSVYTCQGQLLHLETIRLPGQRKPKMQIMMLVLLQKNYDVIILQPNSEKFSL